MHEVTLFTLMLSKQEVSSNAKVAEKIRSIHALTLRKHKMDKERKTTLTKMAAAHSFSVTLPLSTPSKRPCVRPDWVLRRDKMRDIEHPLAAVCFVMDTLRITPK